MRAENQLRPFFADVGDAALTYISRCSQSANALVCLLEARKGAERVRLVPAYVETQLGYLFLEVKAGFAEFPTCS